MDTNALIEESIDQLESLAACLAQQLQPQPPVARRDPEQRLCKEALLSISVLLPKLKAVRGVRPLGPPAPRCAVCDD